MTADLLDLAYQAEGARFLAARSRGGCFDEMGLGKSAEAIMALDKIGAKRGIVVCPAGARQVWPGEFAKFGKFYRRILKATKLSDLNLWLRHKVDVLIISYEHAQAWRKYIEGDLFEFLIFDEAHYLRNKGAQRTIAMLGPECDGASGLARWAVFVWFLTGTPNFNDAADIWAMMRFSGATRLTQRIFRDRYYTARVGSFSAQHDPRPDMVAELRQAIRSFSITRTLKDVGLQLPPMWITTVTVDGDTAEIRDLIRQYPGLEKSIMDAVEKGGLSFLDAQHVMTLRRLVGEAKAPAYAQLVKEELDGGLDKIVIFGFHVRALGIIRSELTKAGYGSVLLDGSTTETAKVRAEQAFKTDPDCRAFIANYKSGGTALTLTSAARLDMLEQAWSPGDNAQPLKRVHRIGQTKNVHCRFISLANSLDVNVAETVARKTRAILQVGAGSLGAMAS